MKVELTKEQIEFVECLCYNVSNDYDNYSPKQQKEREEMASEICCALEDAEE